MISSLSFGCPDVKFFSFFFFIVGFCFSLLFSGQNDIYVPGIFTLLTVLKLFSAMLNYVV